MIKQGDNYLHSDLTDKIIGCVYDVYNVLGYGFMEKVYENALVIKLKQVGLDVVQQAPIKVYFEGQLVGDYIADIIVGGTVIIEIKAIAAMTKVHEVQLVNYLKATGIKVGLLVNFGESLKITRRVLSSQGLS
jgi:GxxExxY protein